MKVLVTGSGGWIGGKIAQRLIDRGDEVIPFDRTSGQDVTVKSDVFDAVKEADHVVHVCGVLGTHELFDRPFVAVDTNIGGTLNILEAIREFGTDKGYTSIVMPKVNPSLYSVTKNAAMDMAHVYYEAFGIPVSHAIAYNAYGPGQHVGPGYPQKILPTFACHAWAGLPIPIWGDGELWTDMVHVDDVARMMVDAMSYGDSQIFDAGTGHPLTVREVAHYVHSVVNNDTGVTHLPERPGERKVRTEGDYALGHGWQEVGWSPRWDLLKFADAVRSYENDPEVERLRSTQS